jgi:hypothetical protein
MGNTASPKIAFEMFTVILLVRLKSPGMLLLEKSETDVERRHQRKIYFKRNRSELGRA